LAISALPELERQRRALAQLAVAFDLGTLRADAFAPVDPLRGLLKTGADRRNLFWRQHAGDMQHHDEIVVGATNKKIPPGKPGGANPVSRRGWYSVKSICQRFPGRRQGPTFLLSSH
jgi:hypothetical protein